MKKVSLLFVLLALILASCGTKETVPVKNTVVGIFTPYFYFPETLQGSVQKLKEVNYWAVIKGDSIEAGDRISVTDRDSLIDWTNDLEVFFDESGLVTKTNLLDEKNTVFGHWEVESADGKISEASWIKNDTTQNYVKLSYSAAEKLKMERFQAKSDSLINYADVTLNEQGQKTSMQWYNSAHKPGGLVKFQYDTTGVLESYSVTMNDTLQVRMSFVTNDEGFFKSQEVYSVRDSITETYVYDYTYDEQGNWVSYVAYKDGEPEVVCKRTYSYFSD